jgi:hypothetical protein
MGRGRIQRAAQMSALAETLGHDGGPQTPKSAPGAAGGPSGKQTTTQDLFPSKMLKTGGKAGADAGGARVEGATFSTPGGGSQHAPRPAQGASAREQADEGPTSTTVQDVWPSDNTSSKPDKRQNTGESGDDDHQARQAPEHRRIRRLGVTALYDTWHSLLHLEQAQIQQGELSHHQDIIRDTRPAKRRVLTGCQGEQIAWRGRNICQA